MRRSASIALILLLFMAFLASCSWQDVDSSITSFGDRISSWFEKETKISLGNTTAPLPPIKECSSESCIRDAFSDCAYAEGEFNDTRGRRATMRLEPMTLALGEKTEMDLCKITYTIITSHKTEETGKNLDCILPLILLSTPEETLMVENPFCGGTLFDLLKPYTAHNAQNIAIENFTIQEKTISFFFENNDKTIYLKNVSVYGMSFQNCTLTYKNPVRINKKEPQTITLGCQDIQAAGSRTFGIFFIDYFTTPQFVNATSINGTFIGTVDH
jgi:hypothetical protein